MKYNPFKPSAIVHPGMFSGRTEEIDSIKKSLLQARYGNPSHFLIEGERGIGKSSLLLFMNYLAKGDLSGENFNFLTIPIELHENTSDFEIMKLIASGLKTALSEK